MMSRPDSVKPSNEVPHVRTNLEQLSSKSPVIVWFGHSSYFIHVDRFNILVDPVFSGNASPFRFFGKAFDGADSYEAEDFPKIDLLVLTHDHYDHLDWPSIRELDQKVEKIVTSLGVGSHLEYWGVDPEKITELDWWEGTKLSEEIEIKATPSRHFSGRGLKRVKTLWSSFVMEVKGFKLFMGGDSGYDGSFKKIGEKFGPFDLAFLECGQYGIYWPQIHMFPEQTLMAANDLDAAVLFPVHWGKFVLSTHPWNESISRLAEAANREKRKFVAPKIGEPFYLGKEFEQETWWNFI
ncbi:MBL fold metallo-hydrolase [Actinomadura fibrosa]